MIDIDEDSSLMEPYTIYTHQNERVENSMSQQSIMASRQFQKDLQSYESPEVV